MMTTPPRAKGRLLDLGDALPALRSGPAALVRRPLERMLSLDRMNDFMDGVDVQSGPEGVFDRLLNRLALRYRIEGAGLDTLPAEGPVIVVANHPLGGADALVLAHLLSRRRGDTRLMANHLLSRLGALSPWLIPVDPFGDGEHSVRRNFGPMRAALQHLRAGGCLGVFPAGEVSSLHLRRGTIADREWSPHIAALVRKSGATVVPVCFAGKNSLLFQTAGLVHPRLRTALLPREFLRRRGQELQVRIGRPVPAARLAGMDDAALMRALRMRVELLRTGTEQPRPRLRFRGKTSPQPAPVAPAGCPEQLAAEIAALPADSLLACQGGLEVRVATAAAAPAVLQEIGRLREITFRAVGEGTGRCRDLDAFDQSYLHLFLWHPASRSIAGAYRMGLSEPLMAASGLRGFYTHTLFKFRPDFFRALGHAIELGRSFVTAEWQRKPNSLFLLWRGICEFVSRNPQYRTLFGPVSISQDYSAVSRQLMVEFLHQRHGDARLGGLVRPRHPFALSGYLQRRRDLIAASLRSMEEVSALVHEMETDGKGVPVLLKQYVRMNAVLLQFNVDPDFANALDGLVVVDLLASDRKLLSRYMGEPGMARFLAAHQAKSGAAGTARAYLK